MQKSSLEISLEQLVKSPTNPRQSFPPLEIDQLAASMADPDTGQLQALIVRPMWCAGCSSHAQIEARKEHAGSVGKELYEVVDGARRHLAAPKAGFTALRCEVREMTDSTVISVQLITFLQKKGLAPLEEARGFKELLALKGEDGKPLNTMESIARTLGVTRETISRRVILLRIESPAREALEDGRIGVWLATAIARIPLKEDRLKAAQAIVAPGRVGGDVMSVREAKIFIQENFMVSLGAAPFDTADEALEPEAGACAACLHRTGNNPELFGDVQRGDTCTKPTCYRNKCRLAFARATKVMAAAEKDVRIEADAEKAGLFSAHDGVSLPVDSAYVDFTTKPPESFVSSAVDYVKLPTWERLCGERALPKVLAQDRDGRMRTLVKRDLAIAAAIENGEEIFVSGIAGRGARSSPGSGSATAAKTAETEKKAKEKKKAEAVTAALVSELRDAVGTYGHEGQPLFCVLLELAMEVCGADALWQTLKLRGLKKGLTETTEQAFIKLCDGEQALHDGGENRAYSTRGALVLLMELMLAHQLRAQGAEKSPAYLKLAGFYQIDVAAVSASAKATADASTRGARGAKAGKPGQAAEGRGTRVEKPITDPEILTQWVKARDGGMSDEKIAATFKVPVADVTGALGAETVGVEGRGSKDEKPGAGKISAAQRSDAEDMIKAGYTGTEIAEQVRISLPMVALIKKQLIVRLVEEGKTAIDICLRMKLSMKQLSPMLEGVGYSGPGPWRADSQPAAAAKRGKRKCAKGAKRK